MSKYANTINFWDKFYNPRLSYNPSESIPIVEIEDGLRFLSENCTSVIDYGCGHGKALLRSLSYGINEGCGIDISPNAINLAKRISKRHNLTEKVNFIRGGIDTLTSIDNQSYDGAILFNILDNIKKEDGQTLIRELHRILIDSGHVLLKLNSCLTKEECKMYDLDEVDPNFYIDTVGTFLWNISDSELDKLIDHYFKIEKRFTIDQNNSTNRLYYLKKIKQ